MLTNLHFFYDKHKKNSNIKQKYRKINYFFHQKAQICRFVNIVFIHCMKKHFKNKNYWTVQLLLLTILIINEYRGRDIEVFTLYEFNLEDYFFGGIEKKNYLCTCKSSFALASKLKLPINKHIPQRK